MNQTLETFSEQETKDFAKGLAAKLPRGSVLALVGQLGAGKTCFVQGMALALDTSKSQPVHSPTFTIINEYKAKKPLYHVDFYRLKNLNDACDLGLEEYFDGDGITVVEWADRFPQIFPARTLWIKFSVVDENKRRIEIRNL